MKIRIIVIVIITTIYGLGFTSCSDNNVVQEMNMNDHGGSSTSSVTIIPTLDWGASQSEVITKQNTRLSLTVSNDSLLRFTDITQEITLDYNFASGKLIGASLTQPRISSIGEVADLWLTGYNQLVQSETTLLSASKDNSTLAYGKILKGSEYDYASVAWTTINADEEENGEPDFSPSGQENGQSYVDLGVGIGWAVQNVGAASPEEVGGYYMWGETVTRTSSWWWYYSLYKGNLNENLNPDKFYTPYSNISGTNYDAAKVKMGGKWRMPTRAEFYTLINNCEMKVGDYNGISGFIVTGPSGKSIFLPVTGQKKKENIRSNDCCVYLWSSTSHGDSYAYVLEYMTKNIKSSGVTTLGRYFGLPIRGVVDLK